MIKVNIIKEKYIPFEIISKQKILCWLNPTLVDNGRIYVCDELLIDNFNGNDKNYLISVLIKVNYPQDRMDAIRNNYDLVRDGTAGDKTQEYTEEYLAMQAWRREAKELASEIMDEYEASQQ